MLENKNLNNNKLDAVKGEFFGNKYLGLKRRHLNKSNMEALNKKEKGKKYIFSS